MNGRFVGLKANDINLISKIWYTSYLVCSVFYLEAEISKILKIIVIKGNSFCGRSG